MGQGSRMNAIGPGIGALPGGTCNQDDAEGRPLGREGSSEQKEVQVSCDKVRWLEESPPAGLPHTCLHPPPGALAGCEGELLASQRSGPFSACLQAPVRNGAALLLPKFPPHRHHYS